tara:strand:+ start:246 stop:581 length:336 start_codon:yes stop_codon:yes gene_type:complete
MLGLMLGQTTKPVTYEESIKIEIIARKHAKEDFDIFVNKRDYYLPKNRILNYEQTYRPELYSLYKSTYLNKIKSIKKGKNITKYLLYTAGGCSMIYLTLVIALAITGSPMA